MREHMDTRKGTPGELDMLQTIPAVPMIWNPDGDITLMSDAVS